MDSTSQQTALQVWNTDVSVKVTCEWEIPQWPTYLNITSSYNLIPSSGTAAFTGRNTKTKPALWWAESMLSAYWIQLTDQVLQVNTAREEYIGSNLASYGPVYKGWIGFSPIISFVSQDITSLDYFRPDCFWTTFNPNGTLPPGLYCDGPSLSTLMTPEWSPFVPSVWIPADSLAKSFQSTILTVLGQTRPIQTNILNDAMTLEHFTQNISVISKIQNFSDNKQQDTELSRVAYSPSSATEPVAVPPSVISTTYFCQIPQRKSTGSLIMSLVLADLVYLQALWKMFKLAVDSFTAKRYPHLNCCGECSAAEEGSGEYKIITDDTILPKEIFRVRRHSV